MGNSFWQTPFKPVPVNKQSSQGIAEPGVTQPIITPDARGALRTELLKNCEFLERKLKIKPLYGVASEKKTPTNIDKITADLTTTLKNGFDVSEECGLELVRIFAANIKSIQRKRIFPQEFYEDVHDSLNTRLADDELTGIFTNLGIKIRSPEERPKKPDDFSHIKIFPVERNRIKKDDKPDKPRIIEKKENHQPPNRALKHKAFENLKNLLLDITD